MHELSPAHIVLSECDWPEHLQELAKLGNCPVALDVAVMSDLRGAHAGRPQRTTAFVVVHPKAFPRIKAVATVYPLTKHHNWRDGPILARHAILFQ